MSLFHSKKIKHCPQLPQFLTHKRADAVDACPAELVAAGSSSAQPAEGVTAVAQQRGIVLNQSWKRIA